MGYAIGVDLISLFLLSVVVCIGLVLLQLRFKVPKEPTDKTEYDVLEEGNVVFSTVLLEKVCLIFFVFPLILWQSQTAAIPVLVLFIVFFGFKRGIFR